MSPVQGRVNERSHADLASWHREVVARDGLVYAIRPIHRDDGERERAFILNLSSESRYSRLLHAVRDPPPDMIDRFVNVDYQRQMAFVATVGAPAAEHFIGVARYACDEQDCEFAVVVADEWQDHGVATSLLQLLFEYARAQGVRRVHCYTLAQNYRMLALARDLGLRTPRSEGDGAMVRLARDL